MNKIPKEKWDKMTDAQRAEEFINLKLDYIRNTPITDGVHNVCINQQIIDLLEDLISDIRTIDFWNETEKRANQVCVRW